jgi:hypothetical protein
VTERQRDVQERLGMPEALLSRTDLAELGLPRRGVDAVFRALPVVVLPGYSRPMVRVSDYRDLARHRLTGTIVCARESQAED